MSLKQRFTQTVIDTLVGGLVVAICTAGFVFEVCLELPFRIMLVLDRPRNRGRSA